MGHRKGAAATVKWNLQPRKAERWLCKAHPAHPVQACSCQAAGQLAAAHWAKGWIGGWARQAAAAAPLSAARPYLARSEASGA